MREAFINWRPRGEAVAMVQAANDICAEYQSQGYDLTLRQLYYQFVSRDLIPNTMRSYKRLGTIVDQARLSGMLDWAYIVDRTRNVYRTDGEDTSPEEAVRATASDYARKLWEDQPYHVEVWVEKEALAGVIQRAAQATGVNYFSCRGYVSQSEMYSAGRRFRYYTINEAKKCRVIHLGDHDPSGIDMTRDIEARLDMFAGGDADIRVKRIALNMDQVEQYNPPPNPAKVTDARFEAYEAIHGDQSWELDALDPATLNDLIREAVLEFRDEELWNEAIDRQESERALIEAISDNWDDVVMYLGTTS